MGRPRKTVPDLCRHSDGRLYVSDPTRLTPRGRPTQVRIHSQEHYRRWCAEYLTRAEGEASPPETPTAGCTVETLGRSFLAHAEVYYRKCGRPTSSVGNYRLAISYMLRAWPGRDASSLRANDMERLQEVMIAARMARGSINALCGKARTIIRWGVRKDAVDGAALERLRSAPALQKNRTLARETPKVLPAPMADVERMLPHLKPLYRAMALVQLYSGARPQEVRGLRPAWIDRTAAEWVALVPEEFDKTYHKRGELDPGRRVWFGPRAQAVLAPLLQRADPDRPVFTLKNAIVQARTYGNAIHRACRAAGVPRFGPNRLRHTQATAIRARFGLEGAAAVLGHADAETTLTYAERDAELARRVAAELG